MAESQSVDAMRSKYEGVSPRVAALHRAHRALGYAYLVWVGCFLAGIALYHAMGKPAGMSDTLATVFVVIFGAIWLASSVCIFVTNFFVRRFYATAIVGIFFQGFLMLFPIVNAAVVWSMAPDLTKPDGGSPAPRSTDLA